MSNHYGDFGNIKPIASGEEGDSNPKKKLVKVEKEEGEHGPKRIWNPTKPIEMESGETVTKEEYIRSGSRKSDRKLKALELAIPAAGSILAALIGKKKP